MRAWRREAAVDKLDVQAAIAINHVPTVGGGSSIYPKNTHQAGTEQLRSGAQRIKGGRIQTTLDVHIHSRMDSLLQTDGNQLLQWAA